MSNDLINHVIEPAGEYEPRGNTIQAIHWNGTNEKQVQDFVKPLVLVGPMAPGYENYLWIYGENLSVEVGDVVVKVTQIDLEGERTGVVVMEACVFEALFQKKSNETQFLR